MQAQRSNKQTHKLRIQLRSAYSTSCSSRTEPAIAAAKPVVATLADDFLGSVMAEALPVALAPAAMGSVALGPAMTGFAVSLAAAVLLALTAPTAEAVAFLTVAVPFLLGAAAMGSSMVAFLRVAGWADATPVGGRVGW